MKENQSQSPNSQWHLGRILIGLSFIGIMAFPVFYWFDTNHFFNPEWHIHARFHILWKTVLVTSGGLTGLWLVFKHWNSSITRSIVRWIPAFIWGTHLICNIGMTMLVEENVFEHHEKTLWGITVADWAIAFTFLIGLIGGFLDRKANKV